MYIYKSIYLYLCFMLVFMFVCIYLFYFFFRYPSGARGAFRASPRQTRVCTMTGATGDDTERGEPHADIYQPLWRPLHLERMEVRARRVLKEHLPTRGAVDVSSMLAADFVPNQLVVRMALAQPLPLSAPRVPKRAPVDVRLDGQQLGEAEPAVVVHEKPTHAVPHDLELLAAAALPVLVVGAHGVS